MSETSPLPPPEPTYQAIEAALAGHEPGRRFLAEHARRSRHADTAGLLEAVARLGAIAGEAVRPAVPAPGNACVADLRDLRGLTAVVGESLAAAAPPDAASEDDVFDMVEHLGETAWTLRESGADGALCDLLDRLAVRLGRVCRGYERSNQEIGLARDAVRQLDVRLAGIERRLAGLDGAPDLPLDTPAADEPPVGSPGMSLG